MRWILSQGMECQNGYFGIQYGEFFSASPSLVIGNSLPKQGLILQLGCKTKDLSNSVDYISGGVWGCVLAHVQSRLFHPVELQLTKLQEPGCRILPFAINA